jgi:hypothetical protein
MTVAVAFLCTDGVVIGVDSMLTPSVGTLNVGHHHARKLDVLPGSQIYAFAGDLGQAHRFKILAEVNHARPSQAAHALDYPIGLSQGLIAQFMSTGIWAWRSLEWIPKSTKWQEWKRPQILGCYIPNGEPRMIANTTMKPRIHQSVLDRMDLVPAYKPINFPESYEIES